MIEQADPVIQWHIGCSGFYYRAWKDFFYPRGWPQKRWFEYYCQHFDTLELNVTFYRFPQLSALQSWYDRSPAHFLFSVKAPKLITHFRKFEEVAEPLSNFYEVVAAGLQEKLGCVLFQLPPSIAYSPALLEKIIKALDPAFSNVVEFRHASWWREEVYEALAQHHIACSGMSHPSLPEQVIANTDCLYYRFHGKPVLYESGYSDAQLEAFCRQIQNHSNLREAYIYFNNTTFEHALNNAKKLMALSRGNALDFKIA